MTKITPNILVVSGYLTTMTGDGFPADTRPMPNFIFISARLLKYLLAQDLKLSFGPNSFHLESIILKSLIGLYITKIFILFFDIQNKSYSL